MASWTFIADASNQKDLATLIRNAGTKFTEQKTSFLGLIDGMGGTLWEGEDYTLFRDTCYKFDPALVAFADSIEMFAKHFESMATGTEALASTLENIIQNFINDSGDAGSAAGTSGGGATPGTP